MLAALVVSLGVSAWVYYPITSNYFQQDDFLNLYNIVNQDRLEFILRMHGGHLLMTRNALFALFFHLFGTDASLYFWTVLLTHLLNVGLVFAIIHRLTDSAPLACLGSAVWGILPVHEGALGWYSVYGHVIATTCVFFVLFGLARAARGTPPRQLTLALWVLLLLAASTSFGVGIGVTLAMPLVAFLLLPRSPERFRAVLALSALAIALPAIYVGVQELFSQLYGGVEATTVLVGGLHGLAKHARLLLDLVGFSIPCLLLGVFHQPLIHPSAAAYAMIAAWLGCFAAACALSSGESRRRILAFVAVAIAAYGIVAAGRGTFVTPANAVGMARAARFHYLASSAMAIVSALVLAELGRRFRWTAQVGWTFLLLWLGATLAGNAYRFRLTRPFDAARSEVGRVVDTINAAVRAARPGEDVYVDNRPFKSIGMLLVTVPYRFPGWAAIFAVYFPDNVVDGRRVRFLERDPVVVQWAEKGPRTAGLLLTYEKVGRTPPEPETPPWRRRPR